MNGSNNVNNNPYDNNEMANNNPMMNSNGFNNNVNNGMTDNSQMLANGAVYGVNSENQNRNENWKNADVVIAANGEVKIIDKNPHNDVNNNAMINNNPYNSTSNNNPYDVVNDELDNIPEKYRPLSPWAYIGYNILFSIPLVGFIFLIMYAINNEKINRRNYARSYLILAVGIIVISIVVVIIALGGIGNSANATTYGY